MKLLHAGCKLNAMLKNELNMHLKLPFGSQLINFTFFKEISMHTLNAAYDGICVEFEKKTATQDCFSYFQIANMY